MEEGWYRGESCALELVLVAVRKRFGNGDGLQYVDGAHLDGQGDKTTNLTGHGEPPRHRLMRQALRTLPKNA